VDSLLYKGVAALDQSPTQNYNGTGFYQCYCALYIGEYGQWDVMSSDNDTSVTLDDILLEDSALQNANICYDYTKDNLWSSFLSTLVSLSVSVINIILRTVNIILISIIGYHTESNQTKAVMAAVFISTFLNTAILILLTDANT